MDDFREDLSLAPPMLTLDDALKISATWILLPYHGMIILNSIRICCLLHVKNLHRESMLGHSYAFWTNHHHMEEIINHVSTYSPRALHTCRFLQRAEYPIPQYNAESIRHLPPASYYYQSREGECSCRTSIYWRGSKHKCGDWDSGNNAACIRWTSQLRKGMSLRLHLLRQTSQTGTEMPQEQGCWLGMQINPFMP